MALLVDPWLVALIAVGTFACIYVGAIPGLSVTMATSILISFTFRWEVEEALALIAGVFVGGVYGGARTAILLNIPGAPSAVVTALDGYPLALKGHAGEAIGLTTVVSVAGGLLGVAALALLAPPSWPNRGLSGPLNLLIDSTGIKVRGEGEWHARKHGGTRRRVWRKVHLGIDEATLKVRAVESEQANATCPREPANASHAGDAPMLPDLLGQIPGGEEIGLATADGAYDTRRCHVATMPLSGVRRS